MSAKIGMLEQIAQKFLDAEAKRAAKTLVKTLYKVNDDRNTLFHGMWAYHLDPQKERGFPACIWQSKAPIRPADLPDIAARAALATREVGNFLALVNPGFRDTPWAKPRRLFIATENVDLGTFMSGKTKRASI